MFRKLGRLATLLILALAGCAEAAGPYYGLLHSDGQLTDIQRAPLVGRESEGVQCVMATLPGDGILGIAWHCGALSGTAYQDPNDIAAAALAQALITQAASDLSAERPQLAALLPQALVALAADELQRATDELQRQSDAATLALPATNTIASLKLIMAHQLAREQHALAREQLRIRIDVRIVRTVGSSQGIPVGQ